MQLRLDAADRLVELVEERRGAVPAEEAARDLFALAHLPEGMARSLLDDAVRSDSRLAWRGGCVALAPGDVERTPLEQAAYCVVDLETTGLSAGRSHICEIGAVRIEALELTATLQTLVNPRERLPLQIAALTGLADRDLRRAPPLAAATARFLEFAGDAVLVAHNARFDLSFLDAAVLRLGERRLAAPVVDTVWLARRLLAGRASRFGLASLAQFFGTGTRPCHRALPDAEATAEILLHLIGLAQERGARDVGDLVELSAPRRRRVYGKRSLAFGAPTLPGVYLFRDEHGQVLYVGRARDLRARLRSYFRSDRQRPAVEAALAAVASIEWRVLGSELEAALEELKLLRELRPPANARSTRPDRYVYLRARGDQVVVTRSPTPHGPLKNRRRAGLAARALQVGELERPREAVPRLRRKLASLAGDLRYEDAARFRDRLSAVEAVSAELERLQRLRESELCLLAPAAEPGFRRAFFIAAGRVAAVRTVPPGGRLELDAGLAEARRAEPSLAPEDADELLVVAQFLRRPPPELRVVTSPILSAVALRKLSGMTQLETATTVFADRLVECVDRKRSQLVLGLDPVFDLLPVELQGEAAAGPAGRANAVTRFCRGLIDAAAPACVAIKPQLAFFEALGSHGLRAFEDACAYAREAGLLVIADAKRGDIGSTARAYAAAYVEPRDDGPPVADAITVNAYLGRESVEPFLAASKRHGAGLFIVTKTSNAGSADVQDLRLRDGDVLWHRVALLAREWGEELVGERGLSSVGLVIGATYPRAVGEARRLCPQQVLLLPGVGAQGAGPAEVARAFTSGPASAVVAVSRAIDYAFRARGGDWRTAAGVEAARLRDEIWSVSGW